MTVGTPAALTDAQWRTLTTEVNLPSEARSYFERAIERYREGKRFSGQLNPRKTSAQLRRLGALAKDLIDAIDGLGDEEQFGLKFQIDDHTPDGAAVKRLLADAREAAQAIAEPATQAAVEAANERRAFYETPLRGLAIGIGKITFDIRPWPPRSHEAQGSVRPCSRRCC